MYTKYKLTKRQLDEEEDWKRRIVTPRVAVSGVVESADRNSLLFVKRKYEPIGWAFPGGMMELGEDIKHTVIREVLEETNLNITPKWILGVISSPEYDPRWHVVIVYVVAELIQDDNHLMAGDDALSVLWESSLTESLSLVDSCRVALKGYNRWRKNKYELGKIY
ncbi:MAG: NUDIX domain-containing protein [Candidatus Hodarchaeales archaeon]|jgi:8-oxo-dGTP diphosphatase